MLMSSSVVVVVVGHRHPLCCLPRWATRIQPRSRVDRTCACAYHHTLSVSLPRGIRPRTDLRAADPDRCPLSVKPPERSSINRSKVAGQASWAGNWGEEGGELSPEGRVASELAWPGAGAVQRRVAAPAPGGGPPRVIPYHACHTRRLCARSTIFAAGNSPAPG